MSLESRWNVKEDDGGGWGDRYLEKKTPEIFQNLSKDIHLQIHEAEQIPNMINPKISKPKYIIIKTFEKEKEKISKAVRKKWCINYRKKIKWQQIF